MIVFFNKCVIKTTLNCLICIFENMGKVVNKPDPRTPLLQLLEIATGYQQYRTVSAQKLG